MTELSWKERTERRERLLLEASGKHGFYDSQAWLRLRYQVLQQRDACCECCWARGSFSNPLQVDHIKPRSRHPELELDIHNLQILCKQCNLGKGAWDETDWRRR